MFHDADELFFGELFNRKLLFSLDQLVSRFLHLVLFPADGRALGCSLRVSALLFFLRAQGRSKLPSKPRWPLQDHIDELPMWYCGEVSAMSSARVHCRRRIRPVCGRA